MCALLGSGLVFQMRSSQKENKKIWPGEAESMKETALSKKVERTETATEKRGQSKKEKKSNNK